VVLRATATSSVDHVRFDVTAPDVTIQLSLEVPPRVPS
jgi:hypothetical protein